MEHILNLMKGDESMYLTVKQQVKHLSKRDFLTLKELCHAAKNLINEATYNIRQYFFDTKKYLGFSKNYHLLKTSVNYRMLNSNMAEQLILQVHKNFGSFFSLLNLAKEGRYPMDKCKIPHYLPKDGYATLVIGFVRLNGNDELLIPFSNSFRKTHTNIRVKIPPVLKDKVIKEIRIVPKSGARFFEIQYTYKDDDIQRNLDQQKALAVDFGIDNLITAASNEGASFIIDGRRLKSINQWFNKENSRLQSIKDKQHFGKKPTGLQSKIARKRNNQVNDYLSKAARIVIDYCVAHRISVLIVGYNDDFQRNTNMGRTNNQNFVNIPYGRLIWKLEYLCELNGIRFIKQEESYTSKASFFDRDEIPVYKEDSHEHYALSGKRIHRGLYRSLDGRTMNADVNGALNILRKSNVVSMEAIYARGEVDTPVRIRIA